jgi:hypothetical protein
MAQAIDKEKAILDRAAIDRRMVPACHFPFPAIGDAGRYETAYRWKPTQWVTGC